MNWKTIRRETGLIEHVCEHGIGHPNGASSMRMSFLTKQIYGVFGVHGCDSCCLDNTFPGNVYNNLVFAFDMYGPYKEFKINGEKISADQYLCDIDGPVYLYLSDIAEYRHYDEIDITEQIRCAQLDMAKLKSYVKNQPIWWHENYRKSAEFMYWPLRQLVYERAQ